MVLFIASALTTSCDKTETEYQQVATDNATNEEKELRYSFAYANQAYDVFDSLCEEYECVLLRVETHPITGNPCYVVYAGFPDEEGNCY